MGALSGDFALLIRSAELLIEFTAVEVGEGLGSLFWTSSGSCAVDGMLESAIKLLMVGGRGFGIGFSTGLVRPSFISCSDGMRSTSLPLLV